MSIFVLIPGGWSGGWQWTDIANRLRRAGHEVFTPTLTGLGERVHLATPEVGLDTHIQDIVNVLVFEDLHDVILLGYSYSGMVATGVAEVVPERISKLVYLDAFVPEDGQSLRDLFDPTVAAGIHLMAEQYGEGWRVPHDPPDAPHRTPHPVKTFTDPLTVNNPAAARIPRTFILCAQNQAMGGAANPIRLCAMRAQDKGWSYYELDSGHVPMETAPDKLTEILLEIG
jgi:pimeloyl-ACP methyl ester carboxylesterase